MFFSVSWGLRVGRLLSEIGRETVRSGEVERFLHVQVRLFDNFTYSSW